MATIISASAVTVTHGERKILDDITLGIEDGDRTALVGRNGCGKTDLPENSRGLAGAGCRRYFPAGAI